MSAKTIAYLVEQARKYFISYGFREASMDALCSAASLTRGALYHHFGSKEGLFEAVLTAIDREHALVLNAKIQSTGNMPPSLADIALVYLDCTTQEHTARILLRDAHAIMPTPKMHECFAATTTIFSKAIDRAGVFRQMPHLDANLTARFVIGIAHETGRQLQASDLSEIQTAELKAMLYNTIQILTEPRSASSTNCNWREE
jgi:AcrR family transcriptional regulator